MTYFTAETSNWCLWCGEELAENQQFCDADCESSYVEDMDEEEEEETEEEEE